MFNIIKFLNWFFGSPLLVYERENISEVLISVSVSQFDFYNYVSFKFNKEIGKVIMVDTSREISSILNQFIFYV